MAIIPSIRGTLCPMPGCCTLPQPLTYEGPCSETLVNIFVNRARRLPGLGRLSAQKAEEGFLVFRKVKKLAPEAYRLLIAEEGITCEASGDAGFNLALVTLYQLLAEEGPDLTCGYMEDEPEMGWRGFMLDVCRHFFDAAEVKKIIEACALLKLNRLHWHLSDDQGYRIESKRFPRLNEISSHRAQTLGDGVPHGGYYTQDEIREIVTFAAERGIEIVPEIDLPGHTTAILAAYPEFSCTGEPLDVAECFGILPRILCAGKEEVYTFLYELLDEVTALFPAPWFHIGGDEAPKGEWEKCPHCGKALKDHGLDNYEALQAHFTGRLVKMLEKKGKTAIAWNEAMASGQLDPKVIAHYWIEWGPSYCQAEAARGRKFILSNMHDYYLDYPLAIVTMKGIAAYQPNIQGQPLPKEAVWGLEAPLWTEWVGDTARLEYLAFPRLSALAQRAWSGVTDYDTFLKALPAHIRQLNRMGIKAAPFEDATIHGEAALEQITDHFANMAKTMNIGKGGEMTPEQLQIMAQRLRGFLASFMRGSYTDEEIDEVLRRLAARLMG